MVDVESALGRAEDVGWLDPAAGGFQDLVRRSPVGPGRFGDLARGSWLGHPSHPLVVQVPVGAWLGSAVLDLVPGRARAARTLVTVGLLASVPALVSGLAEFANLDTRQRRVALVHAAANGTAWVCYAMSLRRRRRGGSGRLWGLLGLTAVGAGGALGGHLAYAMGAGVRE